MSETQRKWLAIGLVVVLALLHQDVWFWDDATLVGGFAPIGLVYHGGFSVVATLVWAVVVWLVWPADEEEAGEAS